MARVELSLQMVSNQQPAALPDVCGPCPGKGAACGTEACPIAGAVKGSIDFTKTNIASIIRDIAPKTLQISDSIKSFQQAMPATKESSSGGGHIAAGGGVESQLTCETCGDKYFSGSSCTHASRKKAA